MKRYLYYIITLTSLFSLFTGCAYYNTFYNAKKFYNKASEERKKRLRTQVVELSPEEQQKLRKTGDYSNLQGNKASTTEMQDYQKSIEKASSVLEFYPNSKYIDDALMMLGECFYYRREYSKAERKFQELMELFPKSKFIPNARLFMAKTQLGLENFDIAEDQFLSISQNDNFDNDLQEEAAYELAGLYYNKGSFDLASQEYQITAKHSDDKLIKAMSLYRWGECLINLNKIEDAPDIFKKAVKESPNEDFKSQATFKLGEAQSLIADYDAAVKTFSDLLSKEYEIKRIPRIKLQLAENLRLKGELNSALQWYNNIIEEHKRTDAAARSYYSLGEIEQFVNKNYQKAKENYDLVRGEFATSQVAPEAKKRSENIRSLLDLRLSIAELEGRKVKKDSLSSESEEDRKNIAQEKAKDDAPIDLSLDGIWVNYSGRDRPPPKSLQDLSDVDRQRAALMQQRAISSGTDSLAVGSVPLANTELDSAALALQAENEKKQKKILLLEKNLELAELLLFSFEFPDSATELYTKVARNEIDSTIASKAMYSLAYIFESVNKKPERADSLYNKIITFFPDSPQADGARQALGMPLLNTKLDSAENVFKMAEDAYWKDNEVTDAIDYYNDVIEKFPSSKFALKSIYALGWIYENSTFDYELAQTQYQLIVDEYPKSDYAKKIRPKLTALENAKKAEQAREKAIADSLAKLAQANTDSTLSIVSDSTKVTSQDSISVAQPPQTVVKDTTNQKQQAQKSLDSEANELKSAIARKKALQKSGKNNRRKIIDNEKSNTTNPTDSKNKPELKDKKVNIPQ